MLHTKLNSCSLNINSVVWFMLSFLLLVKMSLALLSLPQYHIHNFSKDSKLICKAETLSKEYYVYRHL